MKNAFIFVQTNCNDFFWSRLISKKHFGGTKVKMTNQTKLEVTGVFDYRAFLTTERFSPNGGNLTVFSDFKIFKT